MTETHYLNDILILLAATLLAVPLFQRLKLGSVLGYMFAGIIVGPWGLGFIDQTEEIRHIAEFGVVFLLFIIGIEMRLARLWAMRRMVFGLGMAQVMITGLVIGGIALLLGQPLKIAVIIGFGLALSSTAFGLQILNERRELHTGHGRSSFSILLLQDLAVVPLLALVSLLATETTTLLEGVEYAFLDAAIAIAAVLFVSRLLLTPFLKLVASTKTAEVFTAAAVFIALGTAWLLETAGLSLALGAFLAGLMLAESHYRHQVIADIEPFRGILLGLFFMAVGMTINLGLLVEYRFILVGLVLGLLVVKSGIIWGACRLLGITPANAIRTSMLLSQSGEFGFVLFGLAFTSALFSDDLFQLLTLMIALSMIATPLMHRIGEYIGNRIGPGDESYDISTSNIDTEQPYAVIAGFGRVGRRVATLLRKADLPYLAIEKDIERVLKGRKAGYSVFYGDASSEGVLKAAGAENAAVLVCTLDSAISAVRIVSIMNQNYPDITIHARGYDSYHCDQLLEAGATTVISETLEESLQLGGTVLRSMDVFEEDIDALIELCRKEQCK